MPYRRWEVSGGECQDTARGHFIAFDHGQRTHDDVESLVPQRVLAQAPAEAEPDGEPG